MRQTIYTDPDTWEPVGYELFHNGDEWVARYLRQRNPQCEAEPHPFPIASHPDRAKCAKAAERWVRREHDRWVARQNEPEQVYLKFD